MKTQPLGKILLIPFLLVEIAAMGMGISFPAQSTSLRDSQAKVNTTNPKPIHTTTSPLISQTLPPPSPPKRKHTGSTPPSSPTPTDPTTPAPSPPPPPQCRPRKPC